MIRLGRKRKAEEEEKARKFLEDECGALPPKRAKVVLSSPSLLFLLFSSLSCFMLPLPTGSLPPPDSNTVSRWRKSRNLLLSTP